MGVHVNIGIDRFPTQGDLVGHRAQVCFHYDTSQRIGGTFKRDDTEDPFLTVIELDDGRVILGSECQYSIEGG